MSATTLRKELKKAGYHWQSGQIVWQEIKNGSPGWALLDEAEPPIAIDANHHVLDLEFNDGFGSPQMPRFFARDEAAVYFPSMYDGSTTVVRVSVDPQRYLQGEPTPYPGG